MSRAILPIAVLLALLWPSGVPGAWSCTVRGSFWHLPAGSQSGGYLAVGGSVVTLLRAGTREVMEQKLTSKGGDFSFEVADSTDFILAVSGYGTLPGPANEGGLYFFGDAPLGFDNATPPRNCSGGDIEYGALHVLNGVAAPPLSVRRRPKVSVRPARGRSQARFRLKVRRFNAGETLFVVEERPDATARASSFVTDTRGTGRL